jgi:hypothetical protein
MKRIILSISIALALFGPSFMSGIGHAQPVRAEALPAPQYTIVPGARDACVTPCTRNRARADGGIIDVQTPSSNTLTVAMTGAPAADSYLGCTSTATQTFRLVQDFEVTCSNPAVDKVCLNLDSSLVGYVRSMRNAGAMVRLATASITGASWSGPPLVLVHPPLHAEGTQGRLCNQHLPQLKGPPIPLGHYTLVADFVLDTTASGVCNAHAAADFSPDTSLPAEWVRSRDPFQGVSKKSFGFSFTVSTVAPTDSDRARAAGSQRAMPSPVHGSAVRREPTSATIAATGTRRQSR